jgi:anti-anti-sigma factor
VTEITTAEQLDALPKGSVVLDSDGAAWQRGLTYWHMVSSEDGESSDWVVRHFAPLREIWSPKSDPAITVGAEARSRYFLITVSGHLDEATAPQVRGAVKAARTPGTYRSIAIDLTDAAVHGGKGLSPIVNAYFSARVGGAFYLVAPPKMVRRVLGQISGGSLRTFSTVAELDDVLAAELRAVTR